MEHLTAYDYRTADQIWKRVSPDGYDDIAAVQLEEQNRVPTPSVVPPSASGSVPTTPTTALTTPCPSPSAPTSTSMAGEGTLPGAELDPCCMGSSAVASLGVLEGFIEEELSQRRCALALAQRACHAGAARLLRTIAAGKLAAAQSLKSAYFLITGSCYADALSVERMRWNSLADALRTIYHQEACNGFNYERAADETTDMCLSKILSRLSQESFARADAVMELLSHMMC